MADYSDYSFAARAAQDPSTHPNGLSEIAQRYPTLRATVAANPATFPELLSWLEAQGDPEVARVVAWRRANPVAAPPVQPSTPAAPATPTYPQTPQTPATPATPYPQTPATPAGAYPARSGDPRDQGFVPQAPTIQQIPYGGAQTYPGAQPAYGAAQHQYGQAWGTAPTPPKKKKGWVIPVIIVGVLVVVIGVIFAIVELAGDSDPVVTPSPSQSTTASTTPAPSPTQSATPTKTSTPTNTVTETAGAFDLHVGDCLISSDLGDSFSSVPRVPCSQAHDTEITEIFDVSLSGDYDEDAVDDAAGQRCETAIADYVGPDWRSLNLDWNYFSPTAGSWAKGDREVDCILSSMEDGLVLTSSMEGAAR